MISRLLGERSNRTVVAVMLAADAMVFGAGLPLERYSLSAAADKSSSAATIVGLLFGNLALLAMLFVAIASSTLLINRLSRRFWPSAHCITVERGEIEVRGSTARRS